jgi:hypothetical protein
MRGAIMQNLYEKERENIYEQFLPLYKVLKDLCIYQFLDEFLIRTWSDIIALIHYEDYQWQFAYFKFADGSKLEDTDSIKNEILRHFSYNNEKDFFTYDLNINGKCDTAYVGTVYLHGYGMANSLKPYYLIFVHPRILKKEYKYIGRALLEVLTEMASIWFWRANYLYEHRKKMCERHDQNCKLEDYTEVLEQRNKFLDLTIWPISLWDYIQLTNMGWCSLSIDKEEDIKDNRGNIVIYRNWSHDIRKKLCIRENKCEVCKGENGGNVNDEKELFDMIVPLVPFIIERDIDFYNDKLIGSAFECLIKFKDTLFDRISCDRLNDYSLIYFFAYKLWSEYLDSTKVGSMLDLKIFSKLESIKIIHSCSNILLFLLKKNSNDKNYISSLRWAVSVFGHELLNIEPRFDLNKHLLFAARGEPVLHSLKPYYRDHFFHAIEVCFMGHFLLECKISDQEGFLWEHVMRFTGLPSKEDILKIWYLAALLHDIGYAIEIFNGTEKVFKFFKFSEKIKDFVKDMDSSLAKLSDTLDNTFGYFKNDNPGKDHGILAAEHLNELKNKIKDPKEDMGKYDHALKAIAYHNHRKMKVSFEEEPFAFLLIMCDTIQEWNRPHLNYTNAPDIMLSKLFSESGEDGKQNYTGPLERVKLNVKKDNTLGRYFKFENSELLNFQLHYTNEINLNSGVFNLWIDSTCNLQRLSMEGLPFNINIQFITPKYNYNGKSQYQMHRLREVALETHMTFLHDWFPNTPNSWGSTNDAISHCTSIDKIDSIDDSLPDIDKKELLIINLKELARRKLITEDIKELRDNLVKWKSYNDDRDFQGDYGSDIP